MIKKIKNIIKGNLYYWNGTHNEKAVNSIYNKFSNLNDKEKEIANYTLACCSSLISNFIGPERKKLTSIKITDKKMKTVTAKEHIGILILCFEMYSKILGLYSSENILTQTDKKVFGKDYLIATNEDQPNQNSIKNLIYKYGQAIAEKSKIIDKNDPSFTYSFMTMAIEYSDKISNKIILSE